MTSPDDKPSQRELVEKLLTENVVVRPEELAATGAFGGRNAVYAACNNKQILCFRQGKLIIIPTAPLRKMLGIDNAAA